MIRNEQRVRKTRAALEVICDHDVADQVAVLVGALVTLARDAGATGEILEIAIRAFAEARALDEAHRAEARAQVSP